MPAMNYYDSINSSKRATGMIKSLFGPNECVTFPKSKQMFLNEPFTDPRRVLTLLSVQGILE